MINTLTTQSPPPPNIKQDTSQDKYDNYTSKDDDIFQYLPIDILKSVHHTLQSQPASVEGKLYFLKMFDRTLMSEIGKICLHTSGMLSRRVIRKVLIYLVHRQNLALLLLWHQVVK